MDGTHPAVGLFADRDSFETAIKATRMGAFDLAEKPLDQDRLLLAVRNALEKSRLARENRPNAITPERVDGFVEFDHVGFSYDPSGANGLQLDDVCFTVPAGSTVALVGHTGAGKTSIVNLLSRFYEAQHGVVG